MKIKLLYTMRDGDSAAGLQTKFREAGSTCDIIQKGFTTLLAIEGEADDVVPVLAEHHGVELKDEEGADEPETDPDLAKVKEFLGWKD